MLYFPQSRIELTVERALVAGAVVNAEGAALAGLISAGAYGVQPTTGTNDIFAGVAINTPINPVSLPYLQTVIVPANGIVQLNYLPIAGSILVMQGGTAFTQAAGGTAQSALTATQWVADAGNTGSSFAIDVNVSNAGTTLVVAFRYSPTVMQAMMLQGMVLPGGPAGAYLGQVGVVTRGDVFTSEFDTSANWSTAVGVTLEANGLFGAATTAANAIHGASIIALPSSSSAYLGLYINVPN